MKILGWVLAVCGVGVAMGQGPVGAKRAMTFADLMAMKRVSDPQVSVSGKWVLFSVMEVSLEKNTKVNHLWVVPVGGGKERQVTSNTGESFGRFSPDGKFVSYTGEATKDDPVARITIAVWDEATGTIGVGRTLKAVSGDADGAIWSPDSKHFLFTTGVWPECSVKGGGRAAADPTLRDGAAKDGAPGRLVAAEGLNAGVLRSAQNDTSIVMGGTRDLAGWKGAEAASWAEEDGCDKAKDEAAEADPVKGQVWDELLYRHWDRYVGKKRSHIIEADFSLAGANPRDLTPVGVVGDAEVPTFSLGGPLGYAWAPDSKEVAYVANLDAVPAASTNNDVFTLRLDEVGAKAVKVSTSLGSDDGPAYSPDGKWLAFRSQARGGFESDRFRLMVLDRGMGTALGDSWSYRWNWELMAASGYVVVGINRRGSTGYGQRFIDEVSGDWGGRAYEDLMKGLDYAEGHYPFIDKTRECALGASYGGFMADWVLTHTDRFKCIVTHDGMVDPVGAYGSTEELWFNEWEFRRPEDFPKGWDGFLGGYDPVGKAGSSASLRNDRRKGGQRQGQQQIPFGDDKQKGWQQRIPNGDDKQKGGQQEGLGHAAEPWRYASLPAEEDPFRRWSPMRFIERAKTPTLVIHSQKDYRLDVSQGLELFTALQRLGVPSKMLYFPDEGHWVLKPQNSQLWYDEVGDWCDRWTKTGRYAEQGTGIRN